MLLFRGVQTFARRSAWGGAAASLCGAAAASAFSPSPCGSSFSAVHCADGKPVAPGQFSAMLDSLPPSMRELVPMGSGITVGTVFGYTSGFAIKKAGKAAAFVVGSVFALQQALAYRGYITINWPVVEKDFITILDLNKDGKVDEKDFEQGYLFALKVLQHNAMAVSGGFGAGLLLGFKHG
eukprot:TRINITY_DN15144_c0_g1_i1.p2 TRINITY_DN15144_c0_g1~~TRINITY_DN15144_c0_g1_i1.p2  ORF type:complete len:181 (+),score=61.35 TRINITY_DN15144_c0_g1_i1:86-628(+)